ncbi:HD domain-containing protein [Streptomyces phaeochromogenes]|uniref:HD domain-containing protein n=1 Tax=Streptomyces phaeochromogenes TaxID=1923 RepID=UPI003403FB06
MSSADKARIEAGRRRALLIGITDTPHLRGNRNLADRYPAIDCAEQDVALVGSALERSGYEVTACLDNTGLAPLLGGLFAFFQSCEPGDTAFVYVSCHGESVGDRDYLIPFDAQPGGIRDDGMQGLLTHLLIEIGPTTMLQGLRAGVTAVICLDTCRTKGVQPDSDRRQDRWVSDELDALWLFSCGPGRSSYADTEEGSLFARALAEALKPNSPPNSFSDIVDYVGPAMRRLAGNLPVPPQNPAIRVPSRLQGSEGKITVCEGSEDTLRWTKAITGSELWAHTSGSPAVHQRVKHELSELVRFIVDSCAGSGAHQDDPWHDSTYTERVVLRLDDLVRRAQLRPGDRLSPAETACLLAAPVVHEGIVAVALQDLHSHQPSHLGAPANESSGDSHGQQVRSAAQDVCRAHSQVQRTAETLRVRGLNDVAQAADHWLRHRFVADWDALWERDGAYGSVDLIVAKAVDAVVSAAEDSAAGPRTEEARREVDDQVRQVLGHFTVNPGAGDNGPRVNVPGYGDRWNLRPPVRGNTWRAQGLARLLWTAALLAADPRRMSSVLIDHLGAHEPLRPQDVVTALAYDFDYGHTEGRTSATYGLDVLFRCPHPALHAAVEELVGHADAAVQAIHREGSATGLPPLLKGLPERVTAENLTPQNQRYRRPLERFRLAEDEIRPLLMGTQLYGDRMLAVRELYQNALDACRYRQMRRQYGATQPGCASRVNWTPRISFRQGWDADGRPYIECEDNGAGMTRAKLTSMFARAGKRYEQDPEFVQERRNWRRAGIEDTGMNSRFGIGVFAYFMLADEVVVWTRPVDRQGLPAQEPPLRADIQSGSGLLRVSDTAEAPELGGTLVRLYLAAHEEKQPSLVESLRSILWVSDYEVTAEEWNRGKPDRIVRSMAWEPGVLTAEGPWKEEPAPAGRDAWLVQGMGQLLLDGIVVKQAAEVYGRVFNLRERHAPEPSVDRNRILSYDNELVMRELLAGVPEAAGQWSEVSLRWLWQLTQKAPRLAVGVLQSLPKNATAVLESEPGDHTLVRERVRLAETGCLPLDESLMRKTRQSFSLGPDRTYESAVFGQWQATRLSLPHSGINSLCPDGYPDPAPLDALLFLEEPTERWGWVAALRAAALNRVPLGDTVRALRPYAITGIHVPACDDITSLREHCPDLVEAHLYTAYRSVALRVGGRASAPAEHAPMVLISGEYGLSFGELSQRLEDLRALDGTLPAVPELSPELSGDRASGWEGRRLAGTPAPVHKPSFTNVDWRPGRVSLIDLLNRASLHRPVGELARRIRHFSALGFSLMSEPSPATLEHGSLTAAEVQLLSAGFRYGITWFSGKLSMFQLLRASSALNAPPSEVAKRINDLAAATGVEAPEVPAEAASWVVPRWLAELLRDRKPERSFGPWELIGAVAGPPRSAQLIEELRAVLPILDACGLLRTDIEWDYDAVLLQAQEPFLYVRRRFIALDDQGVTLAYALDASSPVRTVGRVLKGLESTNQHLPLRVPTLSAPEARDLRREPGDQVIFEHLGRSKSPAFLPSLGIQHVLEHCHSRGAGLGSSVRHLSRFTVIGGPTPPGDFTGPHAERLEDFTPDRFDMAAFDAGLLGPGILGPLELVLVAGRFGWTLGEAYERYAPFQCLGLNVTVNEPDEREAELSPGWQDVVILTKQLTGRAPALLGPVDPDHLVLCAEETGLTEPQVRERLEGYARLFALDLPDRKGPVS